MRRLLLGPLAVALLAACLMVPQARAADVPYAGTWKLTVLDSLRELGLWLLEIDKSGKVKIVSGFNPNPKDPDSPDFGKSKLSEVKAQEKALRFVLVSPAGTFSAIAYPGKDKDKMNGSFRSNLSQFTRIKLEKIDATEIDPKTAIKNMPGFADFDAARKVKDKDEQLKEFQAILKDHEGKPITYLVSQLVLSQLVVNKAPLDQIKPVAETYLAQAKPYGHEITIGANLVLAQMLLGYDKTHALALDHAKTASKLLTEDEPKGLQLRVYLTEIRALETNKQKDVKAVIEKLSKAGEATIKGAKDDGKFGLNQLVAQELYNSANKDVVELGLKYADAAVKMLKEDDPTIKKLGTYQLLHFGQDKLKKEDAKKTADKVESLEGTIDKEFEKANLADDKEKGKSILTKFDGRKGKSERVSVVELFTGSECPPCIAADIAFDACLKTYKAKDVVFVQYHLHIPGPDALTNKDTEARGKYYDAEGTPAMYLDGKVVEEMGGFRPHAKARYEALRDEIDKKLESAAGGTIKLKVERKGDKIDIGADVSDLEGVGENVKLRFVLVEDTVRYPGRNGQRLHHHVVRALPGGADGQALEKKSGSHKASVDLAEVRKSLDKYLTAATLEFAKQGARFTNTTRPMALKNLKVIAFVQDDKTKKIFQAIQVEVPEPAKEEKKETKKDKD